MGGIKRTPADAALLKSLGSKPRKGAVINCRACEKEFYVSPSLVGKAKYCSRSCSHVGASVSVERICESCGGSYKTPPSQEKHRGKSRFCSKKCKGESMSISQMGSANPVWAGGVSTENHRARNSKAYAKWREEVFKRCDYTCQACGVRGGSLQADHILPFAFFKEKRFDLSNGRALCVSCHKKTDTYGYKAVIKHGRN